MTKLFCVSLVLIASVSSAWAQTRQIKPEEWRAVMRGTTDFPSNPAPGVPHRVTFWANSYEQGEPQKNFARRIVTEKFSAREGRERRESRTGTAITERSERVWKGERQYERTGDGEWTLKQNTGGQGQYRYGPGGGTDSTKPGPDGEPPPYTRKPGSNEILYFALGERPYRRETVSVYEEVTRHVLVRRSDGGEIHYENRTRYWINRAGRMIRKDLNYVIYSDEATNRILSGFEWENDPGIKPVELPVD